MQEDFGLWSNNDVARITSTSSGCDKAGTTLSPCRDVSRPGTACPCCRNSQTTVSERSGQIRRSRDTNGTTTIAARAGRSKCDRVVAPWRGRLHSMKPGQKAAGTTLPHLESDK